MIHFAAPWNDAVSYSREEGREKKGHTIRLLVLKGRPRQARSHNDLEAAANTLEAATGLIARCRRHRSGRCKR